MLKASIKDIAVYFFNNSKEHPAPKYACSAGRQAFVFLRPVDLHDNHIHSLKEMLKDA